MASSPVLERAWKQSTLSSHEVTSSLPTTLEQVAYLRCVDKKQVSWTLQEEYLEKLLKDEANGVLEKLAFSFAFIFLGDEQNAEKMLEAVEAEVGFSFEFTGLLGRKSRHQTKSSILLAVNILSLNHKSNDDTGKGNLIKAVPLDDSDLVEEFLKKEEFALDAVSCQVLLARAFLLERFQPKNDSDTERMLAYANRIILEEEAALPETRLTALFLKCELESENNKFIPRSAAQLEVLRTFLKKDPINPRLLLLMPTLNQVESLLAELYCKLGFLQKALLVFQDLQMMDEQVACLLNLGRGEEAQSILLKQIQDSSLALNERLRFMCTLGSLKKKVEMIEEAWNLSQGKFLPAARLLGKHFYCEGDWTQACEWLRKVVEAIPNDSSSWFLLGCSYMRVQTWEEAAQALLRTTQIDQEHSQAWNNLAAVYSQKGGMNAEALEALKRASKLDYENYRIWKNIEIIAENLGDTEALALARKRLSEINQ